MSFPLIKQAFNLQNIDGKNLYISMISSIRENKITDSIVTNALVLELSEQVEKQGGSRAGVPPDRLTGRQFSHVLAILGDSERFPLEESVTPNLKKGLWRSRDLARLRKDLDSGQLQPGQRWVQLRKMIPAREPDSETVEDENVSIEDDSAAASVVEAHL